MRTVNGRRAPLTNPIDQPIDLAGSLVTLEMSEVGSPRRARSTAASTTCRGLGGLRFPQTSFCLFPSFFGNRLGTQLSNFLDNAEVTVAAGSGATLTRLAARHVLDLSVRDLGPDIRAKAAICLLDFLSCCVAAQAMPWAGALLRYVGRRPTAPEAHQWGLSYPIAATDAAFGNAVLGHSLIRDDIHIASGIHIGVVVLPAMLALAQRESLSGRALLTGIVAGYEMAARLGMAVRAGTRNRHFRPLGIAGAYGAAAAAVAALHLEETAAVQALGFAANFAAGLNEWAWSGGQEIYVHPGMAARNALIALDLARSGMTASETIIEGKDGVFAAYGSGPQAAPLFAASLNDDFCIRQVRHKPFAGCNFIQTAIAAALALREKASLRAADIKAVAIRTFSAARSYPGCDYAGSFNSVQQSKMSLQYGVSSALLYGRVDEAAYAQFEDPALNRLISLCRIEVDANYEDCYPGRQPAQVEVMLDDGQTKSHSLDDVPWLTAGAVAQRFQNEAARDFGPGAANRIRDMVFSLWDMPDSRALFRQFPPQSACT